MESRIESGGSENHRKEKPGTKEWSPASGEGGKIIRATACKDKVARRITPCLRLNIYSILCANKDKPLISRTGRFNASQVLRDGASPLFRCYRLVAAELFGPLPPLLFYLLVAVCGMPNLRQTESAPCSSKQSQKPRADLPPSFVPMMPAHAPPSSQLMGKNSGQCASLFHRASRRSCAIYPDACFLLAYFFLTGFLLSNPA